MTALVWDKIAEKLYQTGVDHAVLYLQDGRAVVWNGLVSVDMDSDTELKSYYLDGVKYLDSLAPGDFIGKLKAYTYPPEFEEVNGSAIVAPGLTYHNQPSKSFSLSYRTKVGNDIEGEDYGYKLHVLYNIIARPDAQTFETSDDSGGKAVDFSWGLTGTPDKLFRNRPTVHITIDSRTTPPEILRLLEAKLYGTDTLTPSLPPITEIGEYYGYRGALIIVNFGDGTWMAIDESDTFITMLSDTEFQIDGADATYSDPDTYDISSTNVGEV